MVLAIWWGSRFYLLNLSFLSCVTAWGQNPELETWVTDIVCFSSQCTPESAWNWRRKWNPTTRVTFCWLYFTGEEIHIYAALSVHFTYKCTSDMLLRQTKVPLHAKQVYLLYSWDCVHYKIMYEPLAPHGRYSTLICHKILMLIPYRLLVLHTM